MKPRLDTSPIIERGEVAMSATLPRLAARERSGAMNRLANARIGAAATDVAAHGRIDIGIRGLGVLLEQGHRRHDLARLAVPALGHVDLHPGTLHRMAAIRRQPFD